MTLLGRVLRGILAGTFVLAPLYSRAVSLEELVKCYSPDVDDGKLVFRVVRVTDKEGPVLMAEATSTWTSGTFKSTLMPVEKKATSEGNLYHNSARSFQVTLERSSFGGMEGGDFHVEGSFLDALHKQVVRVDHDVNCRFGP